MRTSRSFILLLLGMLLAAVAVILFTPPVVVLSQSNSTQTCDPAQCPPEQPPNKPRPSKTPTDRPYNPPTKTSTPTETQTPTETATPLPSETGVLTATASASVTGAELTVTATNDRLLPVRTAAPPVTPPSVLGLSAPVCFFCDLSWLWLIIGAGLVLVVALLGFLLLRGPLSLGSGGLPAGNDPFPAGGPNLTITSPGMGAESPPSFNLGGHENFTITVKDGGVPDGGMESATIAVREMGGISPDAALDAREAALKAGQAGFNPGGAQLGAHPGGVNTGANPGGANLDSNPGVNEHL